MYLMILWSATAFANLWVCSGICGFTNEKSGLLLTSTPMRLEMATAQRSVVAFNQVVEKCKKRQPADEIGETSIVRLPEQLFLQQKIDATQWQGARLVLVREACMRDD